MTRPEFLGQFVRLCKGLRYEATEEQTDAWFRKIGHMGASVWSRAIDTLLFDGKTGWLPKMDHVLDVLEREAESQRKAALQQDQYQAAKTYARLHQETNEEDASRVPTPGTALFGAIKAFAEREHVRRLLDQAVGSKNDAEVKRLTRLDDALGVEANRLAASIHDEDAAALVERYEYEVVYAD